MNKIIFSLAFLLALTSCNDNSTNEPEPAPADPTNQELITAHSWRLVTRWRDGVIISDTYDDCYMDNTHTYTADGNYKVEEVGDLCSPPQGVITVPFEIRETDDSLFWGTDPYRDNSYFLVTKLDENKLEFRSNLNGFLWEYAFEKY